MHNVPSMTTPGPRLEALIDLFDRDPAASREKLRSLFERDPQSFVEGVVRLLRSKTGGPRGLQCVVGLLVSADRLFDVLCGPLTREETIELARIGMQVDSMADVTLARRLSEEAAQLSPMVVGRIMEAVHQLSDGSRILPWLMRLLRLPDPQLRSKAVLMIGQASRSVKWVQSRLADADPRARANAVEALWGVETQEVREFLRSAARDPNGRVAANSLVGLYRAGDAWMIAELFKMAASETPMLRASAAWAMGETGDWRFADSLARMMVDKNAVVRKRVFSALGRVKNSVARSKRGAQWRTVARALPASPGVRQISVDVSSTDGSAPPKLLATHFLITEDGQPVQNYQVEETQATGALALSFLFPRLHTTANAPWVRGAHLSLNWRHKSDLWRFMYYDPERIEREAEEKAKGEAESAGLRDDDAIAPQYLSNSEGVTAALAAAPGPAYDRARFWDSVKLLTQHDPSRRGSRRLIAYCSEDPGAPEEVNDVIAAAIGASVSVHAIADAYNAALDELCRRTRGRFQIAPPGADVPTLIEDACIMLRSRFAITYQAPVANAKTLQIRVANDAGWGETAIDL
jgi:HEAT repeat protein